MTKPVEIVDYRQPGTRETLLPGTARPSPHSRPRPPPRQVLPAVPLLFRDYLRAHPPDAAAYADVKRRCAARFRHDRHGYVDAKDTFVWTIIRRADAWAQRTGWVTGPSDA